MHWIVTRFRLAALFAGAVFGTAVVGVVVWSRPHLTSKHVGLAGENASWAAAVAVLFLLVALFCLRATSVANTGVTRRALKRASQRLRGISIAQERRSEQRCRDRSVGILQWRDPSGERHTERAEIRDRSAGGHLLEMQASTPVGQVVWLSDNDESLKAMVRHCRPSDRGYRHPGRQGDVWFGD